MTIFLCLCKNDHLFLCKNDHLSVCKNDHLCARMTIFLCARMTNECIAMHQVTDSIHRADFYIGDQIHDDKNSIKPVWVLGGTKIV